MFLIECEIPSLKLAIELLPNTYTEEEWLLNLHSLDETRREASLNVEAHKKRVKSQYDKASRPRVFSEGDLVLVYDQDNDKIGKGNLYINSLYHLSSKPYWKKVHMSYSIMMGNPCWRSEMVSIWRNTLHRNWGLTIFCCIMLYDM